MYKIKHAKIEGIWGWKTIETDFHNDVSIFIGANGTGKTTFINILVSILSVDVLSLENLWFENANIIFESNEEGKRSSRKLTVTRISDAFGDEALHYKISKQTFTIPSLSGKNIRSMYAQRRIFPVVESIKQLLQSIVSFSSLSVSRAGISDLDNYEQDEVIKNNKNISIDNTLQDLMSRLKVYQLKKAEDLKEIAREFQEEVFISVLYNPKIDSAYGLRELSNQDLKKEMEDFQTTYYEMGILNIQRKGKARELIKKHFQAIQESIDYLQKTLSKNESTFEVDKIFAFPLLKRTRNILNAGRIAEQKGRYYLLL